MTAAFIGQSSCLSGVRVALVVSLAEKGKPCRAAADQLPVTQPQEACRRWPGTVIEEEDMATIIPSNPAALSTQPTLGAGNPRAPRRIRPIVPSVFKPAN
jgi:hypothetical protein